MPIADLPSGFRYDHDAEIGMRRYSSRPGAAMVPHWWMHERYYASLMIKDQAANNKRELNADFKKIYQTAASSH